MFMSLCTCVYMCPHVCGCTYVWRPEYITVFLNCSPSYFLRNFSHKSWGSLNRLGCLVKELQDLHVSDPFHAKVTETYPCTFT